MHMKPKVRNDLFDKTRGLERGRSLAIEACWYICKCIFFLSPLPYPSLLKVFILKLFGAHVGKSVIIKPRVNIHFPWKLSLGDFTWLGEEVFILNFEPVHIGSHCCISQRVFICTGNHDYTRSDMAYRNRPITIGDGVWIGAQSFIAPGVSIGSESVVAACSLVTTDLPESMICKGNPCIPFKSRQVKH